MNIELEDIFTNAPGLQDMIDKGYISERIHPTKPHLAIYNYTPAAMWEQMWNEYTLKCRGLVVDDNNRVIGRPFEKFFNLDEYIQKGFTLPDNDNYIITAKMDGSMIIVFWDPCSEEWDCASRGSFDSPQAHWARAILKKEGTANFNKAFTYIFELIHPENRIVVNYGNEEYLVLLTVIHTATGIEVEPIDKISYNIVQKYQHMTFDQIRSYTMDNFEGFVLYWPIEGIRVKWKLPTYVQLHKLMCGLNEKSIWEIVKDGVNVKMALGDVPNEFAQWVETTERELRNQYAAIEAECKRDFDMWDVGIYKSRKETAEFFKTRKRPGVLFSMLDKRDYSGAIWKELEPKGGKKWNLPEDN